MTEKNKIDELLERAASAPHALDPALLARVSAGIASNLKPVRPLPSASMLALALFLITAGLSVISAWALGFHGIEQLTASDVAVIFPALLFFTAIASVLNVSEMIPGARRLTSPSRLLLIILFTWIAVDLALFQNYNMGEFVKEGVPCLRAGLAVAAPTGIAGWLVLRRGFAVDRTAAGLAAGTLAGIAGLAMLELHCPILRTMHIMVWHTAVIPVSALAGALLAKSTR